MEEQHQLRNLQDHLLQLQFLDNDDDGSKSMEYGINCRTIFLDLKHFNICNSLLPDVMHDILEGSLQYELKLLFKHFIQVAGYLSVSHTTLLL